MARILLTSSPAQLDIAGPAFAVVAPGYPAPEGIDVVDVADLEDDRSRLNGGGTMVVVGLSRLLTTSNRVRLGQVLLRPRDGLHRISVDEVLFVHEPWRAFWHFFSCRIRFGDFPDSFRAESTWKRSVELRETDPFSLDAIARWGAGHIEARAPFTFGPLVDEVIPCERDTHEDYAAEKEAAFAEETTIAAIVRRLSRFAAEVEPRRSIPTRSALFRRRSGLVPEPVRIVRTDLGVDAFLSAEVRHLVSLTNGIAEVFAC